MNNVTLMDHPNTTPETYLRRTGDFRTAPTIIVEVGPFLERGHLLLQMPERATRVSAIATVHSVDGKDYPRWLNAGSLVSLALLVAGVVAAFFDASTAAGLIAVAFAAIWFFGTAAERAEGV